MGRKRARGGFIIPWWVWLGLAALAPVVLLNVAVAWLGGTRVSPLSFSFLEGKAAALRAYAAHRASCLLEGHAELEPLIAAAERRHRLPPGLLRALVEVESETRVHRISPVGAMGPGQLMPGTAAMLGVEDPFDPEPALDGSARYLAEQLRRFGDVRLAVAAYNAGPGAVDGRVPRNGETEHYVPRVLAAWAHTRPPPPRPAPPRPAPVAVAAREARKPSAPAPKPKSVVPAKPGPPARARPPASSAKAALPRPVATVSARRG